MSVIVQTLLTYSVVLVGVVFLLLVAAQYWPGSKEAHERHRLIPLNDDR